MGGWRLAACLGVLVTLAALSPAGASAATINVNTTFDDLNPNPDCSLRDAVQAANQNTAASGCPTGSAGADTIVLAGGDYNLRGGQLAVTEQLTVKGIGTDATGVDGNGARVFFATASPLTLSGLTVHDGASAFMPGGGILSSGTVNLTNSTVSGNRTAPGDVGDGGGIYAGTVNLTNSTVSRNRASDKGGGIHAATVNLTNSTVSDNSTSDVGGGIYAGTVNLTNSTVSGNGASGGGGAADGGGGIYAGTVNLTNSTVSGNTAVISIGSSGGGGGISASTVNLTNSTVSGNNADGPGGGIYGAGTLTRSIVRRNTADRGGAGIFTASGSLTLNQSTIAANDATSPSTGDGAGVFFSSPGTLQVTNSTISGNESQNHGGGIFTDEGTTNLANATIADNTADLDADFFGNGAGINASGSAAVNLKNTIIAANNDLGAEANDCIGTVNSQGYNLFSSLNSNCTITGTTTGNQTVSPGLALLAKNGGATLTQALILGSAAINHGYPGSGAGQPCTTSDQRGVPRSLGGRCDVGAYERVSCHGKLVNLVGTSAANTLIGTTGADGILGLGGNDVLRGGSGGDGLCGQDGNDQLFGEAGPDFLDGGGGTDTCNGGTESDQAVLCETISSIP